MSDLNYVSHFGVHIPLDLDQEGITRLYNKLSSKFSGSDVRHDEKSGQMRVQLERAVLGLTVKKGVEEVFDDLGRDETPIVYLPQLT